MTDFRRLERELVEAFEAAEINIIRDQGDVFAVVASLPDCGRPRTCRAGFGPYGKTECADCELEVNMNAHVTTLSITKLAERLSTK